MRLGDPHECDERAESTAVKHFSIEPEVPAFRADAKKASYPDDYARAQ